MTQNARNFTVADPRTFDGDPFEVADRAVRQTIALVQLALEAGEGANVMARNAEMERECQRGEDPDSALTWLDSPQGRQFNSVLGDLATVVTRLGILRKAAAFNPRNPPKA